LIRSSPNPPHPWTFTPAPKPASTNTTGSSAKPKDSASPAPTSKTGSHTQPAEKAHVGQVAALEVLAPIRDVIAQWDSEDMLPAHVVIEALAPLVYSTEELNRE